jgi:hypothetical protein
VCAGAGLFTLAVHKCAAPHRERQDIPPEGGVSGGPWAGASTGHLCQRTQWGGSAIAGAADRCVQETQFVVWWCRAGRAPSPSGCVGNTIVTVSVGLCW